MAQKFFRKKLKNGITVLFEKRDLPVVSLSITNKFGAAYETSNIKGIAHFIEHLVFTGTKTRTHEDISREIEKRGGILNAFTSQQVTSFWFKLPSEHLFTGLDILTDMLNDPIFNTEKFEKEKKVVIEEIKMYHDMPQRHVFDKIEENLFAAPFGEGAIGSVQTINALNRDFVAGYFKQMYNPKNYIVTVVGKADFKKLCTYLEKNFTPTEQSLSLLPIKKQIKEIVEERPGIDQAHFVFAFHAPLPNTKESYALEVLDAYLANGMSSKLFLKIREERGLAYSVRSGMNAEKDYSYYTIYVGTTKPATPQVKEIIIEEFAKVASEMKEKDLQESKERLIGLKRISAEESSNVMNDLMFHELAGAAEDYYAHEKNIRKVKLDQVKKIAKITEYATAAIVPQ